MAREMDYEEVKPVEEDSQEHTPPNDGESSLPFGGMLSIGDRRDSLVGSIIDWIARAIIEGRLQPGDDLNSVDLAHRFNTSRAPVREALILLEQEGLVEIQARRRPRVATMSIHQVRELYQVRAALHALVAELIVTNASDEE